MLACGAMNVSPESTVAWEPLTPRGVAAFSRAPLSRLLLVQFAIAALATGAIIWFLTQDCFPTVRAAIQHLPDTGAIRDGRLDWPGGSPQLLVERRVLAFDVDLAHSGGIHSTADVQVEFGRQSVRFYSSFGYYAEWPYPSGWIVAFNRAELEPLWGAWEPEILAVTVFTVAVGLVLVWAILATVYFLPAWLVGFLANRRLKVWDSWKLAGASLLPGALLLTAAILLYGAGFLDLISFGVIFAAHFVLGWVYLFVSQLFLTRVEPAPPRGNPFGAPHIR